MTFGVLTTRHHDGFALWPSKASTFNVGSIPWRSGKGDVVQEYVTAFRAKGLQPGSTTRFGIRPEQRQQRRALRLANAIHRDPAYRAIVQLRARFRFWCSTVGPGRWASQCSLRRDSRPHQVSAAEILIVDHDGIQGPWDADLVMYEEPKGVFSPTGNTIAAAQDNKINGTGGNDWYWAPDIGT